MATRHFGKTTILAGADQEPRLELPARNLESIHTPILGCLHTYK